MRILRLEASSVIIGLKRFAVDVSNSGPCMYRTLELLEVDLELNIAPSAEGIAIDLEKALFANSTGLQGFLGTQPWLIS
jgi:hypothetical protein